MLATPARHGRRSYWRDHALGVSRATIGELWALDDTSGTVALDAGPNGRNGVYTGTTTKGAAGFGDAKTVLSLAAAGNVNVYTAGLSSAWGVAQELSLSGWAQVSAAADWADGTARNLCNFSIDGSNGLYVRKATTSNQLQFVRVGAGTPTVLAPTFSDTAPFHFALTVSAAANAGTGEVKAYLQGAQVGATLTGPVAMVGSLLSTQCVLGASTTGSAAGWKGKLALVRRDTAALSPVDVALLAHCRGFIVFDGDSRTVGGANPYPQQTMQVAGVLALRYGFVNLGVSGQTWADMNADIATQGASNYRDFWRSVAVGWAGVNDAVGGASAATIWSRMQTWAGVMRGLGYKVVLCTEIDGQNANLNGVSWHSTLWPALNTLIRAGWASVADGLADLGANANLQDATNVTYFQADKVHLTDTGYGVVAGIVAAAVAAL